MAWDARDFGPLAAGLALALAAGAGCGGKEFTPASGSAGMATGGSGGKGSGGSSASGGTQAGGGMAGSGDTEPPADVAGDYMVALTNGENTCSTVMDWNEGMQSTGIPFTIVQDGTELTAQAGGAAAIYFVLLTGDNTFTGEIHGNSFVLYNYGTKASTVGNCTYTVNAIVTGTVNDNSIEGTVTYKPAISNNPDCAPYDCQAEQEYSGSRPPPA